MTALRAQLTKKRTAVLNGLHKILRKHNLANYFGLTPGCRNSGDVTQRLGSITKRGSKLVRYLLNQAVMRRLTTILWHMLKKKQKYRYDSPIKKHREFVAFEGSTP